MIEKLDLSSLRSELETRRELLYERINNLSSKKDGNDVVNPDRDDLAHGFVSTEMQAAERARLEESFVQVETALKRMDDGSYGKCERCGGSIAPARLRVLPYASTCIRCQERAS